MQKTILFCLCLLVLITLVNAATLKGNIYNLDLELEKNVLVEINTQPKQQFLAKDGEYSFEISQGEYILKAKKGELTTEEEIKVVGKGEFIFDLFLFPGFEEEEEFLAELGGLDLEEKKKGFAKYPPWSYIIALGIFLVLIGRVILARKKYKKPKKEEEKDVKEKKEGTKEAAKESDLAQEENNLDFEEEKEPAYLNETLEIIKKHEGRISQKELRKELLHLSEAKVSLILTELEHKGRIERIKKGRGKVVILK